MKIKVLGSGCKNCNMLEQNVIKALSNLGQTAEIEKVTDYSDILAYGVSSTPALVIDEELVVSGRVPSPSQLEKFLTPA